MAPFANAFQKLAHQLTRKPQRRQAYDGKPLDNCGSGVFNTKLVQCTPAECEKDLEITRPRSSRRAVGSSRNSSRTRRSPSRPSDSPRQRVCAFDKEDDRDSINTFLRPDNLLMGNLSIRMDQTKPYLVNGALVREIPIRDTTRVLDSKELAALHWIVGESVERHAERTSRYFAHLFRSRELTDVTVHLKDNQLKAHKIVLAAFSPRFHKQFIKERPEKRLMPEICIDVSKFQARAFLRCVEFMYKGCTEVHHYNAVEILNVAQSLKMFPLADMCKNILKSEHCSDLFPNPPKSKAESIAGSHLRQIQDDYNTEPPTSAAETTTAPNAPEQDDDVQDDDESESNRVPLDVSEGPVDFYKLTSIPAFLAWSIEMVEALFRNDDVKLTSELDIIEAMMRWVEFRPDERSEHCDRLLENVRFIHMTPAEMLRCKQLYPQLFANGAMRSLMAKAKWARDLIERGYDPGTMNLPSCRISDTGGCGQNAPPVENIYGIGNDVEERSTKVSQSQNGRAGRNMISDSGKKLICQQIKATQFGGCRS